jgi:acyl-CoA reductase-like NAD-dependent aldehyde dehydrogenase
MPTATKPASQASVLKQYIGGKWVEGSSSSAYESVNPADTRDVVARFKGASKADVNKAVEAAQKAAPAWAKTPEIGRAHV